MFDLGLENKARKLAGGQARLKIIILLACVLGLDSADKTTIGAMAGQLQNALHIGNIQIGLLVTATTGIGALATLPMGVLADCINRVRLLSVSIVFWSAVMIISGFSNSYIMLLLTRLGLGTVVAAALPVISSLTGDYFLPAERGRIWGYILAGEIFGAGFGILISGEAAALFSWRASFWVLSAMSIGLAAAVWKWLPEPARGGQSRLKLDKKTIPTTRELQKGQDSKEHKPKHDETEDEVKKKIEKKNVKPIESLILKNDPKEMSFGRAVRYVLSIRTNLLLIIASSLGYFFFTGIRTFAVVFMRARFDLNASMGKLIIVAVGLGAIIGVLITGNVADRLTEQGDIRARVTVPVAAFIATAILFLAGFYMRVLYIAVPLFFIASACLGGTNAPLDAARLDIMHFRLWGRAESVRTTFRYSVEAIAPIAFGWFSTLLGSNNGYLGRGEIQNAAALGQTFKLMLIPVVIAAVVLYFARRTYPHDVKTAIVSHKKDK